MAFYRYEALDASGVIIRGTMDAGTPAEARAALRERGFHTRNLEPAVAVTTAKPKESTGALTWDFTGRRLKLLSEFSRHLAMLLKSGLPLAQSLAVLSDQIENQSFKEVVQDVSTRIRDGASLDEALSAHPRDFPEFYICIARSGAASGNLAHVLANVATYYTRQRALRDKVISALLYPFIMAIVGFIVIVFLMAFVVPRVTAVLIEQRRALPWPTEVLLATSNFVVNWWWVVLAAAVLLALLFRRLAVVPAVQAYLDRLLLTLPIVGNIKKKQAVARWSDTMSNLLASGIPVLQALSVVKNVLDNRVLRNEVETLESAVLNGEDLSAALKSSKYLPRSLGFVVAVGEESGDLPRVLHELAQSYNEEVEITSGRLTEIVNPVMIVFLGLIVGFIVAAILLPITDFSQVQ